MIITNSPEKGVRCQVADSILAVDPEKGARAGSSLLTLRTFSAVPIDAGDNSEIIGAGEYEIGGIKITGIQLETESSAKQIRTAYSVEMDEIRLCFLGNDIHGDLSEEALDKIGATDILFAPEPTKEYDAKRLAHLIKQIEPKVIIPVSEQSSAEIVKEIGQKPEKMEKFVTKKKELETMNGKVIFINS